MPAPLVLKRGDVFLHSRRIEADRSPAVCRVTAVRRGSVYYGFGRDATKAHSYFVAARTDEHVKEVL